MAIGYRGDFWHLQLLSRERVITVPVGEMLITSFLVSLTMRDMESDKTYPLVIFKDSLSFESHRKLRVLLKLWVG